MAIDKKKENKTSRNTTDSSPCLFSACSCLCGHHIDGKIKATFSQTTFVLLASSGGNKLSLFVIPIGSSGNLSQLY